MTNRGISRCLTMGIYNTFADIQTAALINLRYTSNLIAVVSLVRGLGCIYILFGIKKWARPGYKYRLRVTAPTRNWDRTIWSWPLAVPKSEASFVTVLCPSARPQFFLFRGLCTGFMRGCLTFQTFAKCLTLFS